MIPAAPTTSTREKRKRDRPSDHINEIVGEAAELALQGLTETEIAAQLGISRVTLYRWRQMHEGLRNTLKEAKDAADERVELTLYQKAMGYDYIEQQAVKVKQGEDYETVEVVDVIRHQPADTTSGIFWLKNRQPQRWRDRQDIELSGGLQVENVGDRDLALGLIQLLRMAGNDDGESMPAIEHEPQRVTLPREPATQQRKRREF